MLIDEPSGAIKGERRRRTAPSNPTNRVMMAGHCWRVTTRGHVPHRRNFWENVRGCCEKTELPRVSWNGKRLTTAPMGRDFSRVRKLAR